MNATPLAVRSKQPVLVTGGCGFIGCNIVDALARRGDDVIVLDNLMRPGVKENAQWLSRHRDRVVIEVADIRDPGVVDALVARASAVLHLAGQVAVTTSLDAPVDDFEINARGTLNVLEAVRRHNPEAPVVFASTNKVYGRLLDDADVVREHERYTTVLDTFAHGVREDTPLDFYSPYGCSKGAADQYVRDYARVYGLRSVVLRMSCIYGPRQFGTEDQGWIAHLCLRALRREPITIFGDGYQVRDALHVDDAVAAWLMAMDNADRVAGQVFNLGGGLGNSLSLRELLLQIEAWLDRAPEVRFDAWRAGDQPWYVSDIAALSQSLGWAPDVALADGLRSLTGWLEGRFGDARVSREVPA